MGGRSGSTPRALVDTPDGLDNTGFIVRRLWMLLCAHKWERTPDECVILLGDTTHQMVKVKWGYHWATSNRNIKPRKAHGNKRTQTLFSHAAGPSTVTKI